MHWLVVFWPSNAPLINTAKNYHQIHIHPEDGNCNVCHNDAQHSVFNAAHNREPNFTIGSSRENLRTAMTHLGVSQLVLL
jgi:hypothetical protein